MTDKLHVDATLVAAHRMAELQTENEQLRSKLAEHELLFAIALENDRTLQEILAGIGKLLPRDALARRDARIAQLEAQARVGDLDAVVNIMTAQRRTIEELGEKLRVAEAVRDDARAASQRYLDEKRALQAKLDANAATAKRLREMEFEVDDSGLATRDVLEREVQGLRGQLAKESAANDHYAALLASQEKRVNKQDRELDNLQANYDSVSRNLTAVTEQRDAAQTERDALRAQLAVQPVRMNTSTVNIVDSGTLRRAAEDALKPDSPTNIAYDYVYKIMGNEGTADERTDLFYKTLREVRDGTPGQCPYILDDEDPDEGYWHCKHQADHVGVHETEFGKGRDRRWMMRGNLLPGELSAATEAELDSLYAYARDRLDPNRPREPPVVCACSPKYRELAPGVHAAYCPLAGRPT